MPNASLLYYLEVLKVLNPSVLCMAFTLSCTYCNANYVSLVCFINFSEGEPVIIEATPKVTTKPKACHGLRQPLN